jgi:hypothetical protein
MITECQYIGPEQTEAPFTMCGCKTLWPGRAYCEEHVWKVYKKGSSSGMVRKNKEIENELAELKRLEEIADLIGETDV